VETSSESVSNNSKLRAVLVFLVHQVTAVGIVFPTAITAVGIATALSAMFGVEIHRAFVDSLSRPPYFPAETVWAFFLGWSLCGFLRHRTMLWVWVLPATVLGYFYLRFPHCPTNFFPAACMESRSAYDLYFGHPCTPGDPCLYQLWFTFPFFASAAYSLGAWLAHRRNGLSKYAHAMKHINLCRANIAGGAFVCFAVVVAWPHIPHSFPFPFWYTGLLFLLQFALDLAVVTYVLMVAVGLAGKRFAVTRWFLDDPAPTVAPEPDG
jgi:hypothetical protein